MNDSASKLANILEVIFNRKVVSTTTTTTTAIPGISRCCFRRRNVHFLHPQPDVSQYHGNSYHMEPTTTFNEIENSSNNIVTLECLTPLIYTCTYLTIYIIYIYIYIYMYRIII